MRMLRGPYEAALIRPGSAMFTAVRILPFLAVIAVVSIELSPAHFLYTGPFLTPAPALAALTMGPRGTAAVAVVTAPSFLADPWWELDTEATAVRAEVAEQAAAAAPGSRG